MAKPEVLVVEDENVIAMDLRYRLQDMGYNVCALVTTGEDAVDRALELRPDLLLVDIVLRGAMDGVEAVEQVRASVDIPVVYLSGCVDEVTLDRIGKTQHFGLVPKPFTGNRLRFALETALRRHRN